MVLLLSHTMSRKLERRPEEGEPVRHRRLPFATVLRRHRTRVLESAWRFSVRSLSLHCLHRHSFRAQGSAVQLARLLISVPAEGCLARLDGDDRQYGLPCPICITSQVVERKVRKDMGNGPDMQPFLLPLPH